MFLTVAGGYDKKSIILSIDEEGPEVVKKLEHTDVEREIRVRNPMFVNVSQFQLFLGDKFSEEKDPIFPHDEEYLIWNSKTNLETKLRIMT